LNQSNIYIKKFDKAFMISPLNGEASKHFVGTTRARFDVALVKQPQMWKWSQVIANRLGKQH